MSIRCAGLGLIVATLCTGFSDGVRAEERQWSRLAATLAGPSPRHPDDQFMHDRQPPYSGPGYSSAAGGAPPVNFPASGVQLLAWLPVTDFDPNMVSANDCWGYVSASGREYAIIGLSDGTGFVEVSDPGLPEIVAVIPGPNSLWRDIKVYQNYAYAVSEGGSGIQVIDLSQIDSGTVTLAATVVTGGTTATHNVAINEDSGFLYRLGGGTGTIGLRIYSLANPASPTLAGSWHNRYVHDAQVVTHTSGPFAGRELAYCFSELDSGGGNAGVTILDVTNKASITQVSFLQYSNSAFSHQGWLSPDRNFLYVDDELDEINFGFTTRTRILNVSNPAAPFEVGTFTSGSTSIDHNLYTRGNFIFESNYRSGLRVFDATNPAAPVQTAWFDTYPPDDGASFNGLWSNYPYLPSGIVIGSDIEKGLFVWYIGDAPLAFSFPDGNPALIGSQGMTLRVSITEQNGGTLMAGSERMFVDSGGGFVETALTPLGGGLYEGALPGVPCGGEVAYYVSARTADGITWRDPPTAPATAFHATSGSQLIVGFEDNMETNTGWVVGAPGDTATTGIWVRVDPNGTAAQPEDDNPEGTGTMCWVTGQGSPGGGLGDNDVDGGITTLTSPALDATGGDLAYLVYYRWYSSNTGADPNNDSMPVLISNNNGASWVTLEDVTENAGAWVRKRFRIDAFVTPTDQMRVRFIARDLNSGSIVEAGVDDVRIEFLICERPGDIDNDGDVDADDAAALAAVLVGLPLDPSHESRSDLNGDGERDGADVQVMVELLVGA